MSMSFKVTVDSNLKDVEQITDDAIRRGLESSGMEAVTLTHRPKAQGGTPVDTGRLRNSISWAVGSSSGGGSDRPLAQAPENVLAIGSNVEYAEIIEEGRQGGGGAHMLRNAINDVAPRARKIILASLIAALDN